MSEADDPQGKDPQGDGVLAGEYALGLLPEDQARAFEARLPGDAALRAALAGWAEDLAALTDDIPEIAPPARVWTALEARLFAVRARSWLRRSGLLTYLLGAVAAALVAFAYLSYSGWREAPPPLVAEIGPGDGGLHVLAAYLPERQALRITRPEGLAAPGRALELWLIAGDAAPVSLGVLPEGREALMAVPGEMAARLAGSVLAISDEPAGGSPSGAPTGAVLATGAVTGA